VVIRGCGRDVDLSFITYIGDKMLDVDSVNNLSQSIGLAIVDAAREARGEAAATQRRAELVQLIVGLIAGTDMSYSANHVLSEALEIQKEIDNRLAE
jgi:hypothetical protein